MVGEDCYSVLFVAAPASVRGDYGPFAFFVACDYVCRSLVNHGFYCKYHACLYAGVAFVAWAVGDAGVFVHVKAYSVTAVVIYDSVSVLFVGNVVDCL